MRRLLFAVVSATLFTAPALVHAQTASEARKYNDLLALYQTVRGNMSPAQQADMDQQFAELRASYVNPLGTLSTNPYAPGSTSSPTARYEPNSPANPYSTYGSRYSTKGARNPYTTDGADVVGADGQYLGKLNSNPYDANSVANPYGQYGSPYSPNSVNNQYGKYGSPYSPYSANNPYAAQPPRVYVPVTSPSLPLPPVVRLP